MTASVRSAKSAALSRAKVAGVRARSCLAFLTVSESRSEEFQLVRTTFSPWDSSCSLSSSSCVDFPEPSRPSTAMRRPGKPCMGDGAGAAAGMAARRRAVQSWPAAAAPIPAARSQKAAPGTATAEKASPERKRTPRDDALAVKRAAPTTAPALPSGARAWMAAFRESRAAPLAAPKATMPKAAGRKAPGRKAAARASVPAAPAVSQVLSPARPLRRR